MAKVVQRNSRIKTVEFFRVLSVIQTVLSVTVPNLNNGGCLIFAYEALKILNKHNIKCNLVTELETVLVEKTNKFYDLPVHVYVQLKDSNVFFDGHETVKAIHPRYKTIWTLEDAQLIEELIGCKDFWNSKYNRKKNVIVFSVLNLLDLYLKRS